MCANEVNYQSYGFTTAQWNKLPQDLKDVCIKSTNGSAGKTIARMLNNGTDLESIYTTLQIKKADDSKKADNIENNAQIVGLSLESADAQSAELKAQQLKQKDLKALDELKPSIEPGAIQDIEDNKGVQKARATSWKEYFTERYKNNPQELLNDYIRIEKRAKIDDMAKKMMTAMQNDPMMMKTKYFTEGHATPEEKKVLDERIQYWEEYYSQKGRTSEGRDEYNNAFQKVLEKKNLIGTGETLTKAQVKELAMYKAMNSFDVGPDRIKVMAQRAVEAENFNKIICIKAEYNDKRNELMAKAETTESRNARAEFARQDIERQNEITRKMAEAETPQSKKIRKDFKAADDKLAEEIEIAKLQGNEEKATELRLKRAEAQKKAIQDVTDALDPEKKAEADKLVNERMDKLKEFNQNYDKLLDQKVLKKVAELNAKEVEAVKKAAEKSAKKASDVDLDKMAELMAEAQVDKEIAKARIERTVVHWNPDDKKTIDKNDGMNHTFPIDSEEKRKYIIANGDKFGKPCENGEKGDYEFQGKQYKFDSKMYKDRMIQLAGDHGLDNEEAQDPMYKADLYAQLPDRKHLVDKSVNDETFSAKDARPQIGLKERKMAAELYRGAGLDVGGDDTVKKRFANVGLGFVKGAITGGGIAAFHEWLSTMPTVEAKYAQLAKFSKIVPYQAIIPYEKTHHVELSGDVTLTGKHEADVAYSTQVNLEGVAEAPVDIRFVKDYDWATSGTGYLDGKWVGTTPYSGSVGYSQDYTYSQDYSKDYSQSYSQDHTVYNTSQVYNNGRLTSEITSPQTVTINGVVNGTVNGTVNGSGTVYGTAEYSGFANYEHDYHLPYEWSDKGTIHVDEVVTGQASIPYKQVVDVDGTVHYVADVSLTDNVTLDGDVVIKDQIIHEDQIKVEDEKVVEGKTKARKKMSKEVIGGAALTGGIIGAIGAATEWNKIYDDTDNEYATIRRVVGEKNVDWKPKTQTVTPITQPVTPPVEDNDDDTTPPTVEPLPLTPEPEIQDPVDDCKATASEDNKTIEAVEYFNVGMKNLADIIAKKYGITDKKDLYAAVGIVKEWHGISQAQRRENYWIKQLGLRESLEIPGGKTYNYKPNVDRASIADNGPGDAKAAGYGKYARVEVKAGKVTVSCDGSEYRYETYELAQKVADFYNKNKRMPNDTELAELKK